MKHWPLAEYPKEPPLCWVSIDPGDSKSGIATWQGARCLAAWKTTPERVLELIEAPESRWQLVICERYQLYGWLLPQQTGSEMWTSQMIGALRWTCRRRGIPFITQQASVMKGFRKQEDCLPWHGRCPAANEDARCAYYHGAWALARKMTKWSQDDLASLQR